MPGVVLVLASASPARLATLRRAGVEPLVEVSRIDESTVREATPAGLASTLARLKGREVASRTPPDSGGRRVLVLGCDSVLELDGEVHGKPGNAAEATDRWRRMRGGSGILHTGHWLRDERPSDEGGTNATLGATASTTVHFAALSDTEIDAYVATGEPLRVAGAFTIDGLGGAFVTSIEGDHHNVVGLSVPLVRDLLIEVGVGWFDLAGAPTH